MRIPEGHLVVIEVPDDQERKELHQYFEQKSIKAVGFKLRSLPPGESYRRLFECYHCDYKRVSLTTYHRGDLPNNKDESWTGTCPKCDELVSYEPNYDDFYGTVIHGNNALVLGAYLKDYIRPAKAESGLVSEERYQELMRDRKVYTIPEPAKRTSKLNLIRHLEAALRSE